MPEWVQTLVAVAGSIVGAYAAVRVELRYMRRDLDNALERIERLEQRSFPMRRYTDPPRHIRSD